MSRYSDTATDCAASTPPARSHAMFGGTTRATARNARLIRTRDVVLDFHDMMLSLLEHASGLLALWLGTRGLMQRGDRTLRVSGGFSSLLWAINNVLIGAHSAALISMLSAGRQATSVAVERRDGAIKALSCAAFLALGWTLCALSWNGVTSLCAVVASSMVTYAMFYLRGTSLRLVLLVSSAIWLYHAVLFVSWEQIFANVVSGIAAACGAWKSRQPADEAPVTVTA